MTPSIVLIVIALIAFFLSRNAADQARRSRYFKRTGMVLMGLTTGFLCLFAIGETFQDPGGWQAVKSVALWVLPLVGLGLLGWTKPDRAIPFFAFLTAGVIAMFAWRAMDENVRELEDRRGPLTTIIAFVIAVGVTTVAHKKPWEAGVMLTIIGITPALLWTVIGPDDNVGLAAAYTVIGSPLVLSGILLLLAGRTPRTDVHPRPRQLSRSRFGPAR